MVYLNLKKHQHTQMFTYKSELVKEVVPDCLKVPTFPSIQRPNFWLEGLNHMFPTGKAGKDTGSCLSINKLEGERVPLMCSSQLILRTISHVMLTNHQLFAHVFHVFTTAHPISRLCTNTQQVELTHLRLRKDATPCATSLEVSLAGEGPGMENHQN